MIEKIQTTGVDDVQFQKLASDMNELKKYALEFKDFASKNKNGKNGSQACVIM